MSDDRATVERWTGRAEALLQEALREWDNVDAIPTVDAALQALRIAAGEASEDTMDGYPFPGEDRDVGECICPPGLVERGGFKSGCPVHA